MISSFAVDIPAVPLAQVPEAVAAAIPTGAQLVRWAVVKALIEAATWQVEGAYYLPETLA